MFCTIIWLFFPPPPPPPRWRFYPPRLVFYPLEMTIYPVSTRIVFMFNEYLLKEDLGFVFSWFPEPNSGFLLAGRVPSERYWRAAHPQMRLPQEAQDSEEQPPVQEEVLRPSRYSDPDYIKLFYLLFLSCLNISHHCPPFSLNSFSLLAMEKTLYIS